MRRETLAHLLLLAVVLVWGRTFVLIKNALRDISPLLSNLLRMTLATAALLLVYAQRLRGLGRRSWTTGILAGLLLSAGYQFQTAGLARTTPTKSAFLTGMVVIFVPFFSLLPSQRPPGTGRPAFPAFAGAALGFAGLTLLAIPSGLPLRPASLGSMSRGDLLTLACALAFALHLLTLAHGSVRMPFQALATIQIGTAALSMAVMLLIAALFHGAPHPVLHLTTRLLLALAISALLATAAAFSIQSWAQGFLPASHTALLLSLEPVVAALTSFLFLGEHLAGRALLGAALVLVAILVSELFAAGPILPLSTHEAPPPASKPS